jgi:general secretion pathway protein J
MKSPPSRIGHLSAGFTLIEMMLAVAVLALILAMLAGSFHAIAISKVQAESHLVVDADARAIMAAMANELRGAVQTPLVPSRVLLLGESHGHGREVVDSFSVSTLSPGHRRMLEDFGAEDTVTYSTAPNPQHPGWFLLLRSQHSTLLGIGTGLNALDPTLLAENLLSLRIRYFDGNIWSNSWNSQSQPLGRQLPNEVSLELTMASGSGAPFSLSTAITLPMAFLQW